MLLPHPGSGRNKAQAPVLSYLVKGRGLLFGGKKNLPKKTPAWKVTQVWEQSMKDSKQNWLVVSKDGHDTWGIGARSTAVESWWQVLSGNLNLSIETAVSWLSTDAYSTDVIQVLRIPKYWYVVLEVLSTEEREVKYLCVILKLSYSGTACEYHSTHV